MMGKIADAAVRASHADNEEREKWRDGRLAGEIRAEVVILWLDLSRNDIPLARMWEWLYVYIWCGMRQVDRNHSLVGACIRMSYDHLHAKVGSHSITRSLDWDSPGPQHAEIDRCPDIEILPGVRFRQGPLRHLGREAHIAQSPDGLVDRVIDLRRGADRKSRRPSICGRPRIESLTSRGAVVGS